MGCSADAYLVWGIDLGPDDDREVPLPWGPQFDEDGELLDQDEIDFEEFFGTKLGIAVPTEEWSESEATKRRYHDYWNARREAIKTSGVALKSYGYQSSGSTLIIEASRKSADWAQPERVTDDALAVHAEWPDQMRQAMELLGLTGEPGWLLMAEYG